jgi:hypothetical protein
MGHKDKKITKTQMVVIPDRNTKFIKTPYAVIENQEYREKNKNPHMLLMYLARYVVRAPMKDDLNIYNNYYKNNYLACSITQGHMARAFNVSERTIKRWIKSLVTDEVIRVDKIRINKYKKRNVYIVGTHNNYDSCLFIEEVYTKK